MFTLLMAIIRNVYQIVLNVYHTVTVILLPPDEITKLL